MADKASQLQQYFNRVVVKPQLSPGWAFTEYRLPKSLVSSVLVFENVCRINRSINADVRYRCVSLMMLNSMNNRNTEV